MSQDSILFYALSFDFCKKKKENGEMARVIFPRQTHPSGCATLDFPQLLDAIKSCFKGKSLNFMCTLCVGGYLVD
jgi:hypothetical protein